MRGFTLIELVAVTGIIVLITSIVLVNNNRFGGAILLENLAYDVALSIRQAQIYGISVRQFEGTSPDHFKVSYGVHFTFGDTYNLFGDVDKNGIWNDGGQEDVPPSPYVIGREFRISKVCADNDSVPKSTCVARGTLDIVFKRPEPDALITADGELYNRARIILASPRGDERSVVVEKSGQISVE